MAAITEFINSNQAESFSSHALIYKGTDINEYPVPLSNWYLFQLLLWLSGCLIFTCAHISHGSSCPVISIFIYFAVGISKCSPVCPVI